MDAFDLEVRRHVYLAFASDGRPPSAGETATALWRSLEEVEKAYRRLHDAHALVLQPGTTTIWMANPFSAVETPHRVECAGRRWYANCAWDALGIMAAFRRDGRVESECADCREPVSLDVADGSLVGGQELLVHILVPARRWWEDIGFT